MAPNNFKADLEYGQLHEKFVSQLGSDVSIEVKADRKAFSTGNIFIEVECNSKPSGIMSTQAEYWFHLLPNATGIAAGLLLKVSDLRAAIPILVEKGIAEEKNWAGDGGRVRGVIISFGKLRNLLQVMNKHEEA